MVHFGLFCPPGSGHLNPIATLGHQLQHRGHRVTLINIVDAQTVAETAGIEFYPIGQAEFPPGSSAQTQEKLGQLDGLIAVKYTMDLVQSGAAVVLQEAPAVIQQLQIEALIVDQVSPEAGSIAEALGLPFISVCNALMLNQEPAIPPIFTDWEYEPEWWAQVRNQAAHFGLAIVGWSFQSLINQYRHRHQLPPLLQPNDAFSKLAQISQSPAAFEFPRQQLPDCFHFTGPWHAANTRTATTFPYEQLTGQPLIYASLGTVQNRQFETFRTIAQACDGLGCQLVISLGKHLDTTALPTFAGSPIVVGYAPQLELLQQAKLVITHAGMNTALETLSCGVPMVAIPITNDQPGVAARIAWTGAGEQVPLSQLSVPLLKSAIEKVLNQPRYREQAQRLQQAIAQSGGVTRAADIIEQAVSSFQSSQQ
ncbi:MAG: glycosyl transferase family 1 [Timaviella obliquedivisa GSE-PSE-MK23-08B]|jgi:MGT family glycosyltransferase|nr:glycosyl transferase family 1 [Timaviella obliquedivisa GSE-PSE-MK23-08B]